MKNYQATGGLCFSNSPYNNINYQLKSSIYVATGGHCYATLIKTDIHLTTFDRLVYREIQSIALTLMTSRKARAPELRMITRDSYTEMIKHHSDREQILLFDRF